VIAHDQFAKTARSLRRRRQAGEHFAVAGRSGSLLTRKSTAMPSTNIVSFCEKSLSREGAKTTKEKSLLQSLRDLRQLRAKRSGCGWPRRVLALENASRPAMLAP
jgi:hypothetical protein